MGDKFENPPKQEQDSGDKELPETQQEYVSIGLNLLKQFKDLLIDKIPHYSNYKSLNLNLVYK